ncbi:hypothetical protein DXU07_30855 [Bradyrhizobium elkanii]|nr:hypothetical protein [Bradyrhizobium elkanii]NWL74627.1 hypothetical protein [Bradyrhizobium elkanii]QOZ19075.1 hypothetical protein XI02_31625 [Bradyrhizobium sp. CCBAU 21365]RYM17887.1 hypothetical protein EWH13_36390 [Bradyrhizobium elkanii]
MQRGTPTSPFAAYVADNCSPQRGCRRASIAIRRAADIRAFSSEVDTGSREENASKQESRASVPIQSEPKML